MNNSEEIKKIKEVVEVYSFFLKNSYNRCYPHKNQNYMLFPRTGLKRETRIKISQPIKEKLKTKSDFVKINGEEKLKIRKKTLKLSENLRNIEEESGKKIALFLDRKAISLLQKANCPESAEEANKHLIDKSEIDKYYKLKLHLEISVGSLKHDSRCINESGFIEVRDLVFLINPKARPKKLLSWLYEENKKWYKQENVLRHIVKSGTSDDPGSRIATCSLVPKDIMFISYEYDSLWLWFDLKSVKKEEKSISVTINYCAKVVKKCVFFLPLERKQKLNI